MWQFATRWGWSIFLAVFQSFFAFANELHCCAKFGMFLCLLAAGPYINYYALVPVLYYVVYIPAYYVIWIPVYYIGYYVFFTPLYWIGYFVFYLVPYYVIILPGWYIGNYIGIGFVKLGGFLSQFGMLKSIGAGIGHTLYKVVEVPF